MTVEGGEQGHEDRASGPNGSGAAHAFLHPSLACFVLLAKFLGTPADAEQIAHERGKGGDPYSLEDLSRIAKRFDLIARIRNASLAEVRKVPLPALAVNLSGYLIQKGPVIKDGETVGITPTEKIHVRYKIRGHSLGTPVMVLGYDAEEIG